jgi:hypothetical protein
MDVDGSVSPPRNGRRVIWGRAAVCLSAAAVQRDRHAVANVASHSGRSRETQTPLVTHVVLRK